MQIFEGEATLNMTEHVKLSLKATGMWRKYVNLGCYQDPRSLSNDSLTTHWEI